MKKNISVFGLLLSILLASNVSSASADPTYAVLDSNGNVTNIIVCGSACAGGTFAGKVVVPQVAADPVTNENRGGFWNGPGTTTYNHNTEVFTIGNPKTITNSLIEKEDEVDVALSATVDGKMATQFKYIDTVGDNLFTRSGFTYEWIEDSSATISVNKNNVVESIGFNNRKTENEIKQSVQDSGLTLLNSKVQLLISLLGSWVK
jgi:hypothetical protein